MIYSPGSSPVDFGTPIANKMKMIGIVRSVNDAIFFVVYVNTLQKKFFLKKKVEEILRRNCKHTKCHTQKYTNVFLITFIYPQYFHHQFFNSFFARLDIYFYTTICLYLFQASIFYFLFRDSLCIYLYRFMHKWRNESIFFVY